MKTNMRSAAFAMILGTTLMAGAAMGHDKVAGHRHKTPRPQQLNITVTQAGFEPASLKVKKGVPIVLIITRRTDQTCAKQAVFASLNRTVDLPLNQAVRVELPAQAQGRLSYACGMGMYTGELVVQ